MMGLRKKKLNMGLRKCIEKAGYKSETDLINEDLSVRKMVSSLKAIVGIFFVREGWCSYAAENYRRRSS